MGEDGFYIATRKVNPILIELRAWIASAYGLRALDNPKLYSSHQDVAAYGELERLRDDLAVGRISKDDFVGRLRELLLKYPNVSPRVYQILDELYVTLTGQSLDSYVKEQVRPGVTTTTSQTVQMTNRGAVAAPIHIRVLNAPGSYVDTVSKRRCSRCGKEPCYLRYIGKHYCFNCKTYVD